MNPKYTPNILQTLGEEPSVTNVYYLNAFPGAGKTYRALTYAKETLSSVEISYVLVYAAPTLALLEQFKTDLEKLMGRRLTEDDLRIVESKRGKPPVAHQLRVHLNGGRLGIKQHERLRDGGVILCTHDCLMLTELRMPGKERVSLIFDEARQCVHPTLRVLAPVNLIDDLRNSYVTVAEQPVTMRGVPLARWAWREGRTLTESQLRDMWERYRKPTTGQVENLHTVLEHVRNGTLHVWVAFNEEQTKNELSHIHVQALLSPARLFYGWGKVLIMSAFFKNSQMYHLLKHYECDMNTRQGRLKHLAQSPEDSTYMIDATADLQYRDRISLIEEQRLRNTTMTYILHDQSLTKTMIKTGVVVPRVTPAQVSSWSAEFQRLFALENNPKGISLGTFRGFQNDLRSAGDLIPEAIPRAEFFASMKPLDYSVVQYMSLAAIKLQRAWLSQQRIKREPLLMCINTTDYGSADNDSRTRAELWDQENLDDLLNGKASRAIRVPVRCQGLNAWKHLRTAAFLATLKMTREQVAFFGALMPDYNADLDRTVEQCIQFVFRSNVRDANSKERCLFIVSDKKLADQVNSVLGSHIKIVKPRTLVPNWEYKTVAMYRRQENPDVIKSRAYEYHQTTEYKSKQRAFDASYNKTEYRKEYKRLSRLIDTRRTKLRADPKNDALAAEYQQLLHERDKLRK